MKKLYHLDKKGNAWMVDVCSKKITHRIARASCKVRMKAPTLKFITSGKIKKGDVFTVAKVAGIMAAKKTYEFIPMCHPIVIDKVQISFDSCEETGIIKVNCEVVTQAKTGVEMEALTAVTTAALTIYDMCKAYDRGITISDIKLVEKRGGKSGTWKRK